MTPALEIAAVTHPGRVRPHNEDAIAANAQGGFAVLADGMGGHNAGEVASRIAVEVVSSQLAAQRAQAEPLGRARAEAIIESYIEMANTAVFEAANCNPAYAGMGTTLVVVLWHDEGVSYGHVGDSRLYLLRADELRRLTRDHSLVQEQLDLGLISARDARYAPHKNVLTHALGTNPRVKADVHTLHTEADDMYLLCSDGLKDMLDDEHIRDVLLECRSPVGSAAQLLVDLANENGGVDNVSVILARVSRGLGA